jgi:hypothetical protein
MIARCPILLKTNNQRRYGNCGDRLVPHFFLCSSKLFHTLHSTPCDIQPCLCHTLCAIIVEAATIASERFGRA